eukprot:704069-Prorocentrum_minimum.AAC.4
MVGSTVTVSIPIPTPNHPLTKSPLRLVFGFPRADVSSSSSRSAGGSYGQRRDVRGYHCRRARLWTRSTYQLSVSTRLHMYVVFQMSSKTGIPFDYVYKVNASPLVVRRSTFLRLGMYHPAMSCVGESGISFDFEYSVRMWKHGYRVGIYYAHFVDFSNSRSTGTWASANGTPLKKKRKKCPKR